MKVINEKKSVNGSILLADGMSIGALSGGIGYEEISGTIGCVPGPFDDERIFFFFTLFIILRGINNLSFLYHTDCSWLK